MESLEDRFWAKVSPEPTSGCWLWEGALSAGKYGSLYKDGGMRKAHRIAYEMFVGAIPEGLDLDHKCRNTFCVNPSHLEPVSRSENLRRSPLMDRNSEKTHCKRGHEFTDENTMWRNGGKWRACRECQRMRIREWRAANASKD